MDINNSPVIIIEDMTDEMFVWLEQHYSERYYVQRRGDFEIWFNDIDDAMAFKLKWT